MGTAVKQEPAVDDPAAVRSTASPRSLSCSQTAWAAGYDVGTAVKHGPATQPSTAQRLCGRPRARDRYRAAKLRGQQGTMWAQP